MNYAVSVTDAKKAVEIEKSGFEIMKHLENFAEQLVKITSYEKPRGIIYHDLSSATELYSTIPLPAYTSRNLIHIHPQTEVWRRIYLRSIEGKDIPPAESYYKSLEPLDVAIIAAHELTHHSDIFRDDFEGDPENMWFEEGMCFYIPRTLMLSEKRFEDISEVEEKLIEAFREEYGEYTLDQFGKSGYRYGKSDDYSSAFYDYWRSTKVVKELVENYFKGSVESLIQLYVAWDGKEPLHEYFTRTLCLPDRKAKELWLK